MADPIPNPPANVPNYLVQAILTTIFCCTPFGIVAIIFAAQVNGKLASGDYAGAVKTSQQAKMWCWVAFGVQVAVYLVTFALMMLGALAGAGAHR